MTHEEMEKTIQFILDHEASLAVKLEQLAERSAEYEKRQGKLEAVVDNIGRKLERITDTLSMFIATVESGFKLVETNIDKTSEAVKRTNEALSRLTERVDKIAELLGDTAHRATQLEKRFDKLEDPQP